MKVNIEELNKVLKSLKIGLSGEKETTDQSNSLAFSNGTICTYNDEISVIAPFDFDFEGVISAKEFLSFVGRLKGSDITFEQKENELIVKSGRAKAGMKLDSEIRMPLSEINIPKRWKKLPKLFLKALKETLFSTSSDMSIPILTTVHCINGRLESTDNDRATIWDTGEELKMDFLIPTKAGRAIAQQSGIEKYNESDGWIHFKTKDNVIFSCRTFEGEYPDLSAHFDVEGESITFPANIKEMLDKASVFLSADFEQDEIVTVSVTSKGLLKVGAEGDNAWFEESTRIKNAPGKDIIFSANPTHLQQILSTVNSAVVAEGKILFEGENFQHIVALEVAAE